MDKQEGGIIKEVKIDNRLIRFFKALVISLCFAVVIFLIFSLLICYTPLSEELIPVISLSVTVLSTIICAFFSSKGVKRRGYLRGSVSGICFTFVLYLISAIYTGNFSIGSYSLVLLLTGLFGGAIGGIFAINTADKNRR